MISMTRLAVVSVLLAGGFVLASCTTKPTGYGPAPKPGDYGYSDQQIESNRYRVGFKGSAATPRARVEDYLLYRAAEITKARGYDYFVVAAKSTEATPARSTSPQFSIGGFGIGGGGGTGVGGGAGVTFGGNDIVAEYQSYADVVLMKGPKPPGDVRAFTADEVLARVGSSFPPAPPPK